MPAGVSGGIAKTCLRIRSARIVAAQQECAGAGALVWRAFSADLKRTVQLCARVVGLEHGVLGGGMLAAVPDGARGARGLRILLQRPHPYRTTCM